MHPYLAITLTVLYWLLYPVYCLLYWVAIILIRFCAYIVNPLLSLLVFIAQPFIFAAVFVESLVYLPFRFLARFEVIYTYFGIAVIIGITAGAVVYVTVNILSQLLGLRTFAAIRGPTAREHRETRRQKANKPQIELPRASASPQKQPDPPQAQQVNRLGTLPTLTIQSPSPRRHPSLLEQLHDDPEESDF